MKVFQSHHEYPGSCQDLYIGASELLSLHVCEPPGLRVLAAKGIGGIREVRTIVQTSLYKTYENYSETRLKAGETSFVPGCSEQEKQLGLRRPASSTRSLLLTALMVGMRARGGCAARGRRRPTRWVQVVFARTQEVPGRLP